MKQKFKSCNFLSNRKAKSENLQTTIDANTHISELEDERQQLANDMQGAAKHLRLVALQKSAVTRELEQVHAALGGLEKQLESSRSENDRLRHIQVSDTISAISNAREMLTAPADKPPSTGTYRRGAPATNVRVSRHGSIHIDRGFNGGICRWKWKKPRTVRRRSARWSAG